jgi:peptidoglycan/LPS O-acetylase OafA/YrhL
MASSALALPSPTTVLPRWIPPLDGLRGLAILLVIFAHFGETLSAQRFPERVFRSLFDFGGTGVDLFFVLSGFLITGILLDSRDAKNYFSAFYMRRILRIFPLYYFALLLVLGLIIPLERIPLQFNDVIWYFVYAQNWTLAIIPHLGHFWSLGIEEQFYFIWPLVVWAAGRRRVFQIAIAGSLFSLALRLFLVSRHVDVVLIYHNLFTRMDTLLVGAACACIIREFPFFKLLAANRWLGLLPGFTLPLIRIASHAAGDRFVVNQTVGYTLVALSYGGLLLCLVSTLSDRNCGTAFLQQFHHEMVWKIQLWSLRLAPTCATWCPNNRANHAHPIALVCSDSNFACRNGFGQRM